MKNSTASNLLERSLPAYRYMRVGFALAFFAGAAFCIFGELTMSGFDRSFHWIWIVAMGAFLSSYMMEWAVEGEAQRYRDLGDE